VPLAANIVMLMPHQPRIITAMGFGLIWSVALLWCGEAVVAAVVTFEVALMCICLAVGSVVSVYVAVLAARGFF
jgi:hypothetical protein